MNIGPHYQTEEFRLNYKRNKDLADQLKTDCRKASQCGNEKHLERYLRLHKFMVNDRITHLLDIGSPFLELSQLAGLNLYAKPRAPTDVGAPNEHEECRRGGIVTGIGLVNKVLCMVIANDATVKGGSYYPITVKKHLRAQQIAIENHLPIIYLVDSAGANLLLQADIFPDDSHFGKIFYNQAKISAMKIPQMAVVLGMCTAGGAYIPCMCDETIIVKGNGTIFLGGPALVQAATGEEVDAQSLGGADVHCRESGVADYFAESELEALSLARRVAHRWKRHSEPLWCQDGHCSLPFHEPLYPPEQIYGILSETKSHGVKPFDVRGILSCLLDSGALTEFKRGYDENLVCGFGSIYGTQIGVIANNGVIFSKSAVKAAHFIQLCCSRGTPILFVQNVSGFMIGKEYEREGIAKAGAKMVHAVSTSSVPKITLIIGGSYGAGNYAMCGRAFQPRFLFSWPGSRTAVMSGKHANDVMCRVSNFDATKFAENITEKYDRESHCYYGSARLWDDGIIDPVDTREVLGLAFKICLNAPITETKHGIFRM